MWKKILLALLALVVVLVLVIALQPSHYQVVRATTIAAAPAAVSAHVDDFRRWQAWSPWATLDPSAKVTFEGPASGTGAIMRWAGNSEVGVGSQTVTESRPGEVVRIRLDFLEPMPGTSNVDFVFAPDGTGTTVTWTMSGENNFIGRAMCLVMDMDKMVGGMFEQGLASLKREVEKASTSAVPAPLVEPAATK